MIDKENWTEQKCSECQDLHAILLTETVRPLLLSTWRVNVTIFGHF